MEDTELKSGLTPKSDSTSHAESMETSPLSIEQSPNHSPPPSVLSSDIGDVIESGAESTDGQPPSDHVTVPVTTTGDSILVGDVQDTTLSQPEVTQPMPASEGIEDSDPDLLGRFRPRGKPKPPSSGQPVLRPRPQQPPPQPPPPPPPPPHSRPYGA